MRVDDITFSRFVNNDLSQAKMIEIEKMLIEDGEINASVQASMLNLSINKDYADDLLGIDKKIFLQKIEHRCMMTQKK